MKKLVLIKFMVETDDDTVFLEEEITKLIRITTLDDIESKVIEKYPKFICFNSIQIIDEILEPSIVITLEDEFQDKESIKDFIKSLTERYTDDIKSITTLNVK